MADDMKLSDIDKVLGKPSSDMSLADINKVLARDRRKREKPEISWPHPYKEELREAVERGDTTVTLGNKSFTIIYHDPDKFRIKPIQGFVPCGEFRRDVP